MLIATSRRYTIRGLPSVRRIACATCGEARLLTEQAAVVVRHQAAIYFSDYRKRSGAFYGKRNGRGDDLPAVAGGGFGRQVAGKLKFES